MAGSFLPLNGTAIKKITSFLRLPLDAERKESLSPFPFPLLSLPGQASARPPDEGGTADVDEGTIDKLTTVKIKSMGHI